MPNNPADTTDIDELIAYIESPEYLRMTAHAQGEDPYPLLGSQYRAPEPEPAPVPLATVHDVQTCTCPICTRTRNRSRLAPVRLRSRKDSFREFAEVLADRREFVTPTNSLRGVQTIERDGDSGRLADVSDFGHALWRADRSNTDYVVYSYNTPIAWHIQGNVFDEWVVPEVSYSATTTQHQNKINVALDVLRAEGADVRYLREG